MGVDDLLVEIRIDFDDNIYVKKECAEIEEDAVFMNCCDNETTTNCAVPFSGRMCIDGNKYNNVRLTHRSEDGWNSPQERFFEARVENYLTCSTLGFAVIPQFGDPDIYWSFDPLDPSPSPTTLGFFSDRKRSDQRGGVSDFLYCCEEIRRERPDWDGRVFFVIHSFSDSEYTIQAISSFANLPVKYHNDIVEVDFECDSGLSFSQICSGWTLRVDVFGEDFCVASAITEDPFYDVYNFNCFFDEEPCPQLTTAPLRNLQFLDNSYSFLVWLSGKVFLRRTDRNLPLRSVIGSSCRVKLPNIKSSNGEVNNNWIPIEGEKSLQCIPEQFEELKNLVIGGLDSLNLPIESGAVQLIREMDRVGASSRSNPGVACKNFVERELLKEEISTITREIPVLTTDCYEEIGTLKYSQDPCCNLSLQMTQCCVPRNVTVTPSRTLYIDETAVDNLCTFPSCAKSHLRDYLTYLDSVSPGLGVPDACMFNEVNERDTLSFTDWSEPFKGCELSVFTSPCNIDQECRTYMGPSSMCLNGICKLPCDFGGGCFTDCDNTTSPPTCHTLKFERIDSTVAAYTNCVERQSAPETYLKFLEQLGFISSSDPVELGFAMYDKIAQPSCLGIVDANSQSTPNDCSSIQTCNWKACNSIEDSQICNTANCAQQTELGDSFCGICDPDTNICEDVTEFGGCYMQSGSDSALCGVRGGTWIPLREDCALKSLTTRSQCLDESFCDPMEDCDAYCYDSSSDEMTCVGLDRYWKSWNSTSGSIVGQCVLTGILSFSQCPLDWFEGREYRIAEFTTELSCTGFCDGNRTITSQSECESTSVELEGSCNDVDACYLPRIGQFGEKCEETLLWTPLGCINASVSSVSECYDQGGIWIAKATNENECHAKAMICKDGLQTSGNRLNQIPYLYSLKNEQQCKLCGGQYISFFEWKQPPSIVFNWVTTEWRKREMTLANEWSVVPNVLPLIELWTFATTRSLTLRVKSELDCRERRYIELLDLIVKNCQAHEVSEEDKQLFTTISKTDALIFTACESIVKNLTFKDTRLVVTGEFSIESISDCVDIVVQEISAEQFKDRSVTKITRTTLVVNPDNRLSYIRNSNGIVVGELASDGFGTRSSSTVSGLQLCFETPGVDVPFSKNIRGVKSWFAVAQRNSDESFTPISEVVALGSSALICMNATGNDEFYPIVLVDQWEDRDYYDSLSSGEIAACIFGAVVYGILLLICLTSLAMNVLYVHNTLPILGLLILSFFLLDRLIYFILIPFGVFDDSDALLLIFSEFPALLFFSIDSLVIVFWAELVHYSAKIQRAFQRLKPIVILLNGILYAVFCIFLIAFLAVGEDVKRSTCVSDGSESTREVIAVLYAVFFILICIALVIGFLWYGYQIVTKLSKMAKAEEAVSKKRSKRRKAVYWTAILALVNSICLLAQASALVWFETQDDLDITTSIAITLIFEVIPTVLFLFLWNARRVVVRGSSTGSGGRITDGGSTKSSVE